MDARVKKKQQEESIFGAITKFDSRINSWGDLVRESRATPNRCTYSMHLSVFSKLGGTQSESFSTRSEQNSTQRVVPSQIEHSATSSQ
jgi:hypothetical protein